MSTRRLLVTLLAVALAVSLTDCGGGMFLARSANGATNVLVVSGITTTVQLVNVVGDGGFVVVTAVTLINNINGVSNSFNFCGSIANQFPLDSFVTVNFTNGQSCATATSIVVG